MTVAVMNQAHVGPHVGRLVGPYCRSFALAGGIHEVAASVIAGGGYGSLAPTLVAAHKAMVTALTLAETNDAFRAIATDLAVAVRARSAIGRMGLHAVPMGVRTIVANGGAVGAFVAEGQAIPVSDQAFSAPTTLVPKKVGAISVITQELARSSDPAADDVIGNDIIGALSLAADTAFFSPDNAGDPATPASVFHGAPHIVAAGQSAADLDAALAEAFGAFGEVGPVRPFVVISRARFLQMSLLRDSGGGRAYPELSLAVPLLAGCVVIVGPFARHGGSPGTNDAIFIVDADAVALADSGDGQLTTSGVASLQMTSTPASGATLHVPMWANNLLAIRGVRWVNWQPRRAVAGVYITF